MVLSFRSPCRAERHPLGLAWLWLETLMEIAFTAPKEYSEMLSQDIRYGLRTLAKNPAFAAIAVLTLALGIGANIAILSLRDSMVLHPLPYADSGRLVQIWEGEPRRGITNWESNAPDFLDWRRASRSFEQIAGYQATSTTLTGAGEPEQVNSARITANLLETLGIRPLLGRISFTTKEDEQSAPVVVLSYGLWHTTFSSDIVSKAVGLDGLSKTVIGVLPESFSFPHLGGTGIFTPMAFTSRELQSRMNHWLYVIARLRPDVKPPRNRRWTASPPA